MNKLITSIKSFKQELVVFSLFLLSRLPALGYDTFNTDVWKWKARTYNFLNSVASFDLGGTVQTYHPGVILMWLGALGVKTFNAYYKLILGINPPDNVHTILGIHFFQKFYVVLLLSICISLAFYILRRLTTVKKALLIVLLFATEPFFVAHSREFHLESLVTLFLLLSVLFLIDYFNRRESGLNKRRFVLISSLFAAFAVLTKSSSLFIFPFAGLIMFLLEYLVYTNRSFNQAFVKSLQLYSIWFLGTIFFFILFWPAMWVKPIETIAYYFKGITDVGIEGDHIQLYFGATVPDPGITFYPVNLLLRLTPEVLIGLMFSIYAFVSQRSKIYALRSSERYLVYISILYTTLFLVYLSIPTKKLDRYIMPMVPFITISSFYGYYFVLYQAFKKYLTPKNYFNMFFACLFVLRILPLLYVHPNYLFYYNPLVGGPAKGIYIVEPKWAIGGNEIGAYFASKEFIPYNDKDTEHVVAFPEKYFTQVYPLIEYYGGKKAVIMDIRKDAYRADYFVYPVWDDLSRLEDRVILEYDDTIKYRGVSLYNVYKKVKNND